ncbi:MAG: sulfur carrier protein ThiS [Candidatus Margulisbacteria bacterium]|nr:sulfur carrier protein ThiS [Candidatus Margulisiibacteriota bacterium]
MITLIINEESRKFKIPPKNLEDLLVQLRLNPLHVIIELNHSLYNAPSFAATPVISGDTIDIIYYMGGG